MVFVVIGWLITSNLGGLLSVDWLYHLQNVPYRCPLGAPNILKVAKAQPMLANPCGVKSLGFLATSLAISALQSKDHKRRSLALTLTS